MEFLYFASVIHRVFNIPWDGDVRLRKPGPYLPESMMFLQISQKELYRLSDIVGLPDFDWAARHYLPIKNYTYYRNGAAGEWSYHPTWKFFTGIGSGLEVMVDITKIESTLSTTILGHYFSAPIFISPCARAGYGHPDGELNLVAAAKAEGQVVLQQLYLSSNDTETQDLLARSKAAELPDMVLDPRVLLTLKRSDSDYTYITIVVEYIARFVANSAVCSGTRYTKVSSMTDLPIILKGIMTVEDAKLAVALEIHEKAPEVFKQIEVYADGGVRYGADVLKLLSLGVKAVGLGRPFIFANIFGTEGIEKAIDIIKHGIAIDAGNLGVGDLAKIDSSYVRILILKPSLEDILTTMYRFSGLLTIGWDDF
ncbi:Glycolate oxidase [Trichoderma cornu-damae]|uniref:Glycolate oxidase n=1 Tax=Trichoderma cornu-damae TaxID=654480 RepID=A0A9P8QPV1_9HYPO|nr:Glycolate oxidase [Trichoderma cornu-damae]